MTIRFLVATLLLCVVSSLTTDDSDGPMRALRGGGAGAAADAGNSAGQEFGVVIGVVVGVGVLVLGLVCHYCEEQEE